MLKWYVQIYYAQKPAMHGKYRVTQANLQVASLGETKESV